MSLTSQLKQFALMLAPVRVARIAARRKFPAVPSDNNNFSDPDELTGTLSAYDVVSFDLFDTLVWREMALSGVHAKTSEFADRYLTGDTGPLPRGLILHARGRFQQAVKARGKAAQTYRNEADLCDVFDGALAPYIRDPARRVRCVRALLNYEIETERRVLRVNPKMRALLDRLRAEGKTLILISDMYFREEYIRSLLIDLGLLSCFDHIFVSATVGVTKHSGKLFRHVDDTLGLHGRRRLHLGDNWRNDVEQPRANGWDALHFFDLENERRRDALDRAYHAGAQRRPAAARDLLAQILDRSDQKRTLGLVATGFSAFSRSVLETAIQEKASRVLFLTRDGTLFHELADQVLRESGAKADLPLPRLDELAFSRRAGVLLNYPERANPRWAEYLSHNVFWMTQNPLSLRTIMRTFGLDAAALRLAPQAQEKVAACLASDDPEEDIGFSELLHRPVLLEALHQALCQRRDNVRAYLEQKGLFDRDETILLVDIGYSGTALKALSEHMFHREMRGQPVRSRLVMEIFAANRYYQGNLNQLHPRASMRRAVMLDNADWEARALAANYAWLEPFAVDRSRGSLRDYQPDVSGVMRPVFAAAAPRPADGSRAELLAAARQAEEALRVSPVALRSVDALIPEAIIRHFARPDAATVREMRALTHHAGMAELQEAGVIARIRPWRLRRDLAACLRRDYWVQGSLRSSGLGFLNPLLNRAIGLMTR